MKSNNSSYDNKKDHFVGCKVVHIHIPSAVEDFESYNAAISASVILAEAFRQRRHKEEN